MPESVVAALARQGDDVTNTKRTVDRLDTRNAAPCRTVQAYLARKVLKEHPDAREPSHVGNIGL
jgi:hypothetical protein